MRISEKRRYDITNKRVENAKGSNAKMLELLSTQKRINKLSDDPVGVGRSIRLDDRLNSIKQFQRNINFAKGYIERSETALVGIHDALMRAKELAVGQASSTFGPDSRKATAREIKELITGVVNNANTSYGSRYVFGGFRSQTPPLSSDGKFLGDDGAIFLQISGDSFRQINLQARQLFEASIEDREKGHFDMIHSLEILYDGLMNNNEQSIHVALEELDFQLEKASSFQATLGGVYNALEGTIKRLEMSEELSTKELSENQDVDLFRATSDFKRTETVLQSTLLASNKLLQPSLLNFMQ